MLVVALSSVIASFIDWLFMGVLFHDKYMAHPEVWRCGSNDTRKIVVSQLIGVISSAALAVLLARQSHHDLTHDLWLAFAVWLAGAAPSPPRMWSG